MAAGLSRYLREAFLAPWNLLVFGGALAAGAISPVPDVVLPLVCAAELAYLAGLVSIPRFQKAIDLKAHTESKKQPASAVEASQAGGLVVNMVTGLDPERTRRFESLRGHCAQMHRLARGVRGGHSSQKAEQLGAPGLDRLLWVFLRLLYSSQALERFLAAADDEAMTAKLDEQLATRERAEKANDERILRSVSDAIATSEMRLENYHKAEKNYEFVNVELDRVEGKIHALTEMGVSSQDPDYISRQVDSVAESMVHTVNAMRDLHHITGLSEELETPPPILEAEAVELS